LAAIAHDDETEQTIRAFVQECESALIRSGPGWRAIAAIATRLIENGKLKGGQIESLCSQAYASRTPPRNWVSEADLILTPKMIRAGYLPS
jgi:hypothetical protein